MHALGFGWEFVAIQEGSHTNDNAPVEADEAVPANDNPIPSDTAMGS